MLNSLRAAFQIYNDIGDGYYTSVSKLLLAKTLYNANYIEESLILFEELLNDSLVDDKIRLSTKVSYAFMKSLEPECSFEYVLGLYTAVIEESGDMFMTERDYWSMAYSYYKLGDKESAREIMNKLDNESGTAAYWKYLIYKDEDMKAALSYLEEYIKYNDIEVSDALKQSLALSQRDYYESQAKISEYKAHNANQTVLIVVLASLFLMFIVFVSIKVYIKRQEQAKEKYLAYINEINRQLEESKKDDYPALKKKYLSLYRSKFETIGALCEQYSTSHDLVNAESSVYRKVVSLVDDFKNDYQNREKFEAMLDHDLDGIMSNLRTELPKLKEMDYSIFSLLVIGFDVTTISHILDVSMNTIYIRKSRIRQNIKELKSIHKSRFLEILD